jgi:hypothetical protein
MAAFKTRENNKYGRECGELELLCIVGRNVKWGRFSGNTIAVP